MFVFLSILIIDLRAFKLAFQQLISIKRSTRGTCPSQTVHSTRGERVWARDTALFISIAGCLMPGPNRASTKHTDG